MIHSTAIVHPSSRVARSAEIGPFCLVGEHVTIGEGAKLLAQVVINGHTTIGEEAVIYPFASIGAPSQDRKAAEEIAYTTIGARTVVREYVSIHRATGEAQVTSVGSDCLLLAYVHIAHNCRIGNNVTMSSTAQLAGHVVVEDYVTIGGQTGVHQFVRIGEHAMIGGISKIGRDIPPYVLVAGNPAKPYGLNRIGLQRADFTPDVMSELKECYNLIYRSGNNISQAAEAMRAIVTNDKSRHLLAFIEAPTERGLVK